MKTHDIAYGTRRILVLLNTIGLVVTVVMNALANGLPLNGRFTGEISDSIPNLFVPSGTTFAIWGVIYALLILFIGYQWFSLRDKEHDGALVGAVGPWFFISSLANSLWIVAWHWSLVGLDLLLMLALLASLIVMYGATRLEKSASVLKKVAVALPVSVYLGWITVATVANATSNLVLLGWNGFGLPESFWTVLVMVVAMLLNILAVFIHGDYGYALVGIWAFFGIYTKRTMSQFEPVQAVIAMAVVGMVAMALAIVVKLLLPFFKKNQR